jgi:hypothetical protein
VNIPKALVTRIKYLPYINRTEPNQTRNRTETETEPNRTEPNQNRNRTELNQAEPMVVVVLFSIEKMDLLNLSLCSIMNTLVRIVSELVYNNNNKFSHQHTSFLTKALLVA